MKVSLTLTFWELRGILYLRVLNSQENIFLSESQSYSEGKKLRNKAIALSLNHKLVLLGIPLFVFVFFFHWPKISKAVKQMLLNSLLTPISLSKTSTTIVGGLTAISLTSPHRINSLNISIWSQVGLLVSQMTRVSETKWVKMTRPNASIKVTRRRKLGDQSPLLCRVQCWIENTPPGIQFRCLRANMLDNATDHIS